MTNVELMLSRTRRTGAALSEVSALSDKALTILFGFGGIGILLVVLVLAILSAGCAGLFG